MNDLLRSIIVFVLMVMNVMVLVGFGFPSLYFSILISTSDSMRGIILLLLTSTAMIGHFYIAYNLHKFTTGFTGKVTE